MRKSRVNNAEFIFFNLIKYLWNTINKSFIVHTQKYLLILFLVDQFFKINNVKKKGLFSAMKIC